MKKFDLIWYALGVAMLGSVSYRWHQDIVKYEELDKAIKDLKFVTRVYKIEVCEKFDFQADECEP